MSKIELSNHPEYDKNLSKWQMWADMYDGDHAVMVTSLYLWLHELEADGLGTGIGPDGAKLRAIRELRSRYLNLIEPIVSRWTSFIMRGEITIPKSVESLLTEACIENIDGNGTSLETFIREKVTRNLIQFGRPIVVVDAANVHARTRAEAKAVGARLFMDIIDPLEAKDWSYSSDPARTGKLQFLRTEYKALAPRLDATEKPTMETWSTVYKLGLDGKYVQQKYKAKAGSDGKANWELAGDIQFESLNVPISLQISDSFIKDAAEMALLVFNFMSAESSSLNAAAFQKIFISGIDDEKAKILINEFLINFIPEGANVTTVEPTNTAALENAIMRAIDWTFKVAFNQIDGLAAQSKESPGADTRREMKDEFIALVESTIGEVEDVINGAVAHWAELQGAQVPAEKIEIDSNVTAEDYQREMEIWQAYAEYFKNVPALLKAMIKKQAKALNVGEEVDIEKEIDAATFDAPQQQKLNPDGTPAPTRTDLLKGLANGNA